MERTSGGPEEPASTDVSVPLTAVVVDDEAIARDGLERILALQPGVKVLAGCRNGGEAIQVIRARRPDVVFMDVEMPDINGIDVVRSLTRDAPPDDLPTFVFVTAYSDHAVEAFDLAASDYLVKPFSDERIALCVGRVHRLRARMQAERLSDAMLTFARQSVATSALAPKAYLQRILIPHGVRTVVVPVNEVHWVAADNDYIVVHAQGKTHLLSGTLSAMEEELDPECFVRAHRSVLVNIDRIVELRRERDGSAALVLSDGTRLPVGRRRYDDIRHRLSNHIAPRGDRR